MRLVAQLALLASVVPGIDGKGTAAGRRGWAMHVQMPSPAFISSSRRVMYPVAALAYSPAYFNTHGRGTSSDEGASGFSTGGCHPVPKEAATKVWVWVQMLMGNTSICATCGGDTNGTDVVTFEVDAFKEIASRVPCNPPTQVLVLRLCQLSAMDEVTGGLADDQLLDPDICAVVGNEESGSGWHGHARARRLLAADIRVVQLVVGATSVQHGDLLQHHIRESLNQSSDLQALYQIPPDPVVLMETTTHDGSDGLPVWAIVLISLAAVVVFLLLMVCLCRENRRSLLLRKLSSCSCSCSCGWPSWFRSAPSVGKKPQDWMMGSHAFVESSQVCLNDSYDYAPGGVAFQSTQELPAIGRGVACPFQQSAQHMPTCSTIDSSFMCAPQPPPTPPPPAPVAHAAGGEVPCPFQQSAGQPPSVDPGGTPCPFQGPPPFGAMPPDR